MHIYGCVTENILAVYILQRCLYRLPFHVMFSGGGSNVIAGVFGGYL